MMNGKFCLIAVCILSLFFYNCNRKLDSTTSTNVYALIKGIDRNIKYYKNGVFHILEDTDAGSASDIYVDGMDVYVSGYEQVYLENPGTHIPKYWKNGKEVILPGNPAYTTDIKVQNGTVYISGAINFKPVYWRNGIVQELELPNGDFFYQTSGIS